jgi:hypothetical protein
MIIAAPKGYKKAADLPAFSKKLFSDLRFLFARHRIPFQLTWVGTGKSARHSIYVESENLCRAISILKGLSDPAQLDLEYHEGEPGAR